MSALLVDSSAIVGHVLEKRLPARGQKAVTSATHLLVSRLALIETTRAIARAREEHRVPAERAAAALDDAMDLWNRCEIWEISRSVCSVAAALSPVVVRTLDAIHLATFATAKKKIPGIRLLTTDLRMKEAARALGMNVLNL